MTLTREQVLHVAKLAKLMLDDEQVETMARQLSDILEYAARLNELDTGAIPPTASVIPNQNVMRPDEVVPSLTREQVMENAPDTDSQSEFIRVKAILD